MTSTSAGLQPQSFSPTAMPDIIDSLKRLERIGSENSKTTEKLLTAAKELERKIVEAFHADRADIIGVVKHQNHATGSVQRPRDIVFREYTIHRGNLCLSLQDGYESVSADRRNALIFSEDIANGLLDEITQSLGHYFTQQKAAAETLEKALQRLQG